MVDWKNRNVLFLPTNRRVYLRSVIYTTYSTQTTCRKATAHISLRLITSPAGGAAADVAVYSKKIDSPASSHNASPPPALQHLSQNRSLRQDLLNLSRGAHAPCPTMTSQPRLRLHDYMSCQLINAMTGILQTVYSSERWFHQSEIRSLAHGHKHGICLPGFGKKIKLSDRKKKTDRASEHVIRRIIIVQIH